MGNAVRPAGGRHEGLLDHILAVLARDPGLAVYRFLADGEGDPQELSAAELDRRARALAAVLHHRVPAGERAVIICPPGLEYITAFLACVYAGVIAVPVYPPDPVLLRRTLPRLLAILRDAEPAAILAPRSVLAMAQALGEHPAVARAWWLAVDEIDPAAGADWQHPGTGPDDIAFLQYTSGSTGRPKGVMVSQGNLMHNLAGINRLFVAGDDDPRGVIWLPPYHDMGLIGGLLEPVYGGFPVTFMSPMAFLKRPERWLRAISQFRGTISGGPNFAFDLCVTKVPAARREGLDLSSWRVAFSGAERVRAQTLDRFTAAYQPYGFRREAFYPCYGLAEGTLLVTGGLRAAEPVVRPFDAAALADGRAEEPQAGRPTRSAVGCGTRLDGQEVLVVDSRTGSRMPDRAIGEIWVAGPSVARGYWRRPVESERTFGAVPADGPQGAGFLRTGDLGFLDGGELFVTGRLKDVIIVAGANHYPDDLERSVERSHPAVRPGCGIAAGYEADGEERVVVVQEVLGSPTATELAEIVAAIRAAIADEHGLPVHDVALVRRGSVPKTSSGKLQRGACRDALLAGELECLHRSLGVPAAPSSGPAAPAPSSGPAAPAPSSAPAAGPDPVGPGLPDAAVEEWEQLLLNEVAQRLEVPAQDLDPRRPLAAYGLASVDLVGLAGELERRLGRTLPPTLAWEYPTVEALAAHLAGAEGTRAAPTGTGRRVNAGPTGAGPGIDAEPTGTGPGIDAEPIAVVGIGCRLPGGADGPQAFWQLLMEGRDAVGEVPADRWPIPPGPASDQLPRWGGFLDGIDGFDPQFFGISAREAARMDPQQRLLAEVGWEALEDAGIPAPGLAGTATGVFVGIATSDYSHLQFSDLGRIDAYTGTGNALSIAANRLSYLLDLRGPSLAVDTACSSSLVAVHQACQSLRSGECALALAGGVNVVLSPALGINFAEAGAMAADGRCKSFDARADGYVRSEGAGMVVLKPLSAAVADGDRVYAVVRGTAVNQDGRTNGLMAPNPQAQQEVLRTAYARAGVDPAEVDYVETHGTGTLLGDPIEARALAAVVGPGRDGRPCLIGSVKSNLGHLEAAAGIAGLIKAALMVHHRSVPASLHFERPNPHIPFEQLQLRVAATGQDWPQQDRPPTVGVSSFGFGGTNAHLVLGASPTAGPAAAPADAIAPTDADQIRQPVAGQLAEPVAGQLAEPVAGQLAEPVAGPPVLLILSARDRSALGALAARYADRVAALDGAGDDALTGFAAAAALRRTAHEHRLACVGDTAGELGEALTAFTSGQERPGLSAGERRIGRRPRPVLVFSGQGARWWPLLGDPSQALGPAGAAVLRRSEALLQELAGWSLTEQLALPPELSRLGEPDVGQPALCAVQLALAATWQDWGVRPQAVVGHSVGEIAAAAVAGAFGEDDALRIALARGQAIRGAVGLGGMAVVALGGDQLQERLDRCGLTEATVAARNGPDSSVASGPLPELERLTRALDDAGVYCRILDAVPFASHGPQMDAPQAELRRRLDDLRPATTHLPMLSTVTGAQVAGDRLDGAYWAANLRRPVLFDAAVTALIAAGHDTFVEVGGHPSLAEQIEQRLAAEHSRGAAVSSLRRDRPARQTLLGELGRLFCAGFDVDWTRVHRRPAPMVPLPTYPWQRTRHWLDDELGHRPAGTAGGHPVLGTHLRSAAEPYAAHWTGTVDLRRLPYLRDHQVDTTPVLPAALLLDAALSAVRRFTGDTGTRLDGVALERITVLDEAAAEPTVQLVLFAESGGRGSFRVFSRRAGDGAGDGDWSQAAHGRFGPGDDPSAGHPGRPQPGLDAVRARCTRALDVAEQYGRLAAAGLQYGPAFQAVRELWAGTGEAVGRLRERSDLSADRDPYLLHPALLDGALQVLAAAVTPADESGQDHATYLPVRVGGFRLDAAGDRARWAHAVLDPADPLIPAAGAVAVAGQDDAGQAGAPAGRLTGTVTVYDDDGGVVGELGGVVLQRLEGPPADRMASAVLELGWSPQEAPPASPRTPGADDGDRWWLLLADRGGVGDALRERLTGRGERCVSVSPGADFRRVDATRFVIRPDRPQDVDRLLAEVPQHREAAAVRVVHAWALDPAGDPDSTGTEPAVQAFERACLPVLHLVQALTRRPPRGSVRLSLLTRGAQRVGDDPTDAGPQQSALWGLGRVVAAEHPELRPHLVDLDPRRDPADLDALLPELLRADGPQQLALRDGARLVPGLVPARSGDDHPAAGDPAGSGSAGSGSAGSGSAGSGSAGSGSAGSGSAGSGSAGSGSVARVRFDPQRHGNHRILAGTPGILDSLTPMPWQRVAPGPGQVEVEIGAAGLNFNDVLKALEVCPGVPPGRVALGAECAGRVVAVGEGVTGVAVGDQVMAVAPSSLAAYATTSAQLVAPRPAGLDDQQAAAVPIAFLTAVYGLEYLARLRPGETVLIHAATGGVGLAALQVARRHGARVLATAGTPAKRELLQRLGVEQVMDSRSLAFAEQVREVTGGRGVDVVLNSLTGEALRRSMALLADNGRFVEIGKADIYADSHVGLHLLRRNRFLFAVDLELCLTRQPDLIAELMATVVAGFEDGSFTALPVTTFGYAEAGDAFAYMAQARHTGKVVLRPDGREMLAEPPAPTVRPDATYLVTGGLGGLGLVTAGQLADAGARTLVLLGRSGAGPQAQHAVDRLRARDVRVVVRCADVARADEVEAVLAEVDADLPPLRGIVHAAGVLEDAALQQQDVARFRAVAGPKVAGAWNLHRASAGRPLDFFVLYSSAAALLGSPGQGNYAAANGFLDGLARHRRAHGLPALSIGWGPWSQVGLAARSGSDDALAAIGISPITPSEGAAALARLLSAGAAEVSVLPVDRPRLRAAADRGLLPPLLHGLAGSGGGQTAPRTAAAEELRRRLLELEPGRRRHGVLLQHCREEAARVLKVDPGRVDPAEPLAGMGIDSLMALELRKRLESSLGIELPATVAWRFPTLEAMTPFLADRMGVPLLPPGTARPAAPDPARDPEPGAIGPDGNGIGPDGNGARPVGSDSGPAPVTVADQVDVAALDGLSELDVEALLLAKLADLDEGRGA